jgi:hypothetical protein
MSRLISFQLSSLIRATVRVELLDVRKWKSEDRSRSWRSVYQAEGRSPATCLNWYDVKAYVDWLAKKTGKHMRGILRQAFQSLHNSRLDPVIVNRARGTRARLVMQAIHSRRSANRRRHLPTVPLATRKRAATSWFSNPCAHSRTIRGRMASACAVFRRDESSFSSVRSASLRTSSAILRPIRDPPCCPVQFWHSNANL